MRLISCMRPGGSLAPEITVARVAGAQVQVVDFKERGPGEKVMIEVHVVVEAASQRGIIIGARGSALKALGSAARVDIEEFLGAPVWSMDLNAQPALHIMLLHAHQ